MAGKSPRVVKLNYEQRLLLKELLGVPWMPPRRYIEDVGQEVAMRLPPRRRKPDKIASDDLGATDD
jgi:hypothetical protein